MFLLCYSCLRDRENNLPSTPFKIHTEFNKNVHAPMKLQLVISATRGWEYFAKDYLWTVFPGVLLWNPQAYSTEVGNCESAKKILFWEAKWNDVFFSKCFSKHSVKTRWWSLFVLGNADFFKFKNASEFFWGNVVLIRVLYREQVMRHVSVMSRSLLEIWARSLSRSLRSRLHPWSLKLEIQPSTSPVTMG